MSNNTIQCPNCQTTFQITLDEAQQNLNNRSIFDFLQKYNPKIDLTDLTKTLPISITVNHVGYWMTNHGLHYSYDTDEICKSNSVIVSTNSLLYVYKLALRHLLLSMRVITPQDIDAQNLVPHIVVKKNNYKTIREREFVIDERSLTIKNDFILIELDRKNDLHMTLIYKKKIKESIDLMTAFKLIIKLLTFYPELIERYANLPYFGGHVIHYWYDTPDSFPFKIELETEY